MPGVLSRLSPVVIDRLEKKRSTVLDNPDGEVSDMKSVNQIGMCNNVHFFSRCILLEMI